MNRSFHIQLIDSFAQTDNVSAFTTINDKMNTGVLDKDMVDSGVVAQLRLSDRTSITEDDDSGVVAQLRLSDRTSIAEDDESADNDRRSSVSVEDEAIIVDNPSSQEVGVFDHCDY